MHNFAWWPTLIVLAVATATDLRYRRIPNWLVFPFLALGIAVSIWLRGGHGLAQSVEGLALGLLIYGFLFWAGGMGAGDVKLCASIGAWIGPQQMLLAVLFTALAGGLMALGWAIWGGFLGELLQGTGDLALGWKRAAVPAQDIASPNGTRNAIRRKMPYAPAIAIGTLISFFAR